MSATPKRKRRAASDSISPPRLKRKSSSLINRVQSSEEAVVQFPVRLFSWNVNGVKPLLQKQITFDGDPAFPLRKFLKRHLWPHILCLQEVKISPSDFTTQRQVRHAANMGGLPTEPSYDVVFSLPRDRYNATGFGGRVHGVASLIRKDFGDITVTTRLPSWDLEGRVLIHELTGKTTDLVVINGYWVNGTANPYRNTETGTVEGTRHDHKLRFHKYMLDEALAFVKQGRHVVMLGDMNVARHRIDGHPNLRTSPIEHIKNRIDFNQKFFVDENGLKGYDIFREIHGDLPKFTYHPRGCGWGRSCDRVDNIITTRLLFDSHAVMDTNICDNPLDRGHSDHVPLWVELDFFKLSGSSRIPSQCPKPQDTQPLPLISTQRTGSPLSEL